MRYANALLPALLALGLVACGSAPERELSTELPAFTALQNGHDPLNPERSLFDSSTGRGGMAMLEEMHGRPLQILMLSGGGQNGAFGAGILIGWSESGRRPKFDVVTGISTGALQATFAFLGTPEDDAVLRELYTGITADDIYRRRGLGGLLGAHPAMFDTAPLAALIEKHVTAETLARVAAEQARGRRLVIGTTNLDYAQLWLWSLGEIAQQGTPEALELYRNLLLAAASPPIAFPAVEISGHLMADGAVTENLLIVGLFDAGSREARRYARPGGMYVIHNGRHETVQRAARNNVPGLIGRSLNVAMGTQMGAALMRSYAVSALHGYRYRLAQVPPEVDMGENPLAFDPKVMEGMFEAGVEIGRRPESWAKLPPTTEQVAPWLRDVIGNLRLEPE